MNKNNSRTSALPTTHVFEDTKSLHTVFYVLLICIKPQSSQRTGICHPLKYDIQCLLNGGESSTQIQHIKNCCKKKFNKLKIAATPLSQLCAFNNSHYNIDIFHIHRTKYIVFYVLLMCSFEFLIPCSLLLILKSYTAQMCQVGRDGALKRRTLRQHI